MFFFSDTVYGDYFARQVFKKTKLRGGTYESCEVEAVSKATIEAYDEGSFNGPVIICGAGSTTNAAIRFYNILAAHGIPIRAVFAFDYFRSFSALLNQFLGKSPFVKETKVYYFKSNDSRNIDFKKGVKVNLFLHNHNSMMSDTEVEEEFINRIKEVM